MPVGAPLDPRAEAKLMRNVRRPSPAKARALALAAIRETFEETGLLLGQKRAEPPAAPEGPWSAFAEANIHPDLSSCISSPARSRRRGGRAASTRASSPPMPAPSRTGSRARSAPTPSWSSWSGCRSTASRRSIELLAITEIVLDDLQARIEAGFSHDLPVPFYRVLHGKRVREFAVTGRFP